MSAEHYENFPVASWLCPRRIRPAVTAIYGFARTADDIADEGDLNAEQRLIDLGQYREDLRLTLAGMPAGPRWRPVFAALALQLRAFDLPPAQLHALLDAFEQDVHNPVYVDRTGLLHYCQRSANPVGRLMLHLYDMADENACRQSDAVCTALQLINFWQDLSVDLARGRHYVPQSDLSAHGLERQELRSGADSPALRRLVEALCTWSRSLMLQGAPLALKLPGRAGFELRLVVQGGLLVLDKIAALDYATLKTRPKLGAADLPTLLWRAWRMGRGPAAARP